MNTFRILKISFKIHYFESSILRSFSSLDATASSDILTSSKRKRNLPNILFSNKHLKIIDDEIQNGEITFTKWSDIKSELKLVRGFNNDNIDSIIIDHLTTRDYYGFAKDYVKYLKENGTKFNIGTAGKLLKLYYFCGVQNNITDKEKSKIIQIYDDLLEKYKILDPITGEHCIHALSITEKWRECLIILDKIKQFTTPTHSCYSCIVAAAFLNNDSDTGWKILQDMMENNRKPLNIVFTRWIDYCLLNFNDNKETLLLHIEKMLHFCSQNYISFDTSAVQMFGELFSTTFKWNVNFVNINQRGKCQNCKSKLQLVDLTLEEFEKLRTAFYDRVMIGNNVFIKSSPKEIDEFLSFLKNKAPFDIVVDSLNAAYSGSRKQPSFTLEVIVRKLKQQYKNILILGRKHMVKWPKANMNYIHDNCSVFLADDLSYDDTFIIYAALASFDTKIVSRDLMRGHKFLLKDKHLCSLFKKWQLKNQIALRCVTEDGNVFFQDSCKFLPNIQKSIGWHIPYVEDSYLVPPDSLEFPEKWVCLQPK